MMKKRKPGAAVVVLALAMLTATVAFGRPAAGSLSVAAPARVAMMSIRGTKMVQGFFRKLVGAYVLARFVVELGDSHQPVSSSRECNNLRVQINRTDVPSVVSVKAELD